MTKKRIYIAGKITGLVYEDALRKFAEAEQMLAATGAWEPLNPMKENGLDGDGNEYSWAEYMKRDIPILLSCEAIYLLPDWNESRGARLEEYLARELGLRVLHAVPAEACGYCDTPFPAVALDPLTRFCKQCQPAEPVWG